MAKDRSQVDWSAQVQMLVHTRAFRTEDIGQDRRTDSMVCPLCEATVASNSMYGHTWGLGRGLIPTYVRVIGPFNPRIPPHEPWLIWMLNEHLRDDHNTTPEIESARLEVYQAQDIVALAAKHLRDACDAFDSLNAQRMP
jgi:hypothetical protein